MKKNEMCDNKMGIKVWNNKSSSNMTLFAIAAWEALTKSLHYPISGNCTIRPNRINCLFPVTWDFQVGMGGGSNYFIRKYNLG